MFSISVENWEYEATGEFLKGIHLKLPADAFQQNCYSCIFWYEQLVNMLFTCKHVVVAWHFVSHAAYVFLFMEEAPTDCLCRPAFCYSYIDSALSSEVKIASVRSSVGGFQADT